MPSSTAEKNRAYQSATAKRKQEAGLRQGTFWLTPEVQERLAKLAIHHGVSRELVVQRAILAYGWPTLRVGQRVIWRSRLKLGVVRHGVVRRWRQEGPEGFPGAAGLVELDVKFDDASDDGMDWRPQQDLEPE